MQISRTNVDEEAMERAAENPIDIQLPDGRRVIQHEESAYENLYTDGRSFDDVDGSGDSLSFKFDFKLHGDGVRQMADVGNSVQSNSFMLQHGCVMYSFAYSLTVIGKRDDDLICEFRLFPIDFSYRYPTKAIAGGVQCNVNQPAPTLTKCTLSLADFEGKMKLHINEKGEYKPSVILPHKLLCILTEKASTTLHVTVQVSEGYFKLEKYSDLKPLKKIAVAPPNSDAVISAILKGRKVPKCDWVITVGEGSPRDFNVHGVLLAESSLLFKIAVAQHMSSSDNQILMVSHENRMILSKIHSQDMEVLLHYIYKRQFVRPKFDSYARVGRFLTCVFRDAIGDFFLHWQAQIVAEILNLDRSDSLNTLTKCVQHLVSVASSPPGSLIVAFNVAMTVAADAWQMAEAKGEEKLKERLLKAVPGLGIVESILDTIQEFKTVLCGVKKTRV
ncbi:unnamed protein product [Caenorhabditis auriculariae]|uniref:BTB domain-containing protein n=1 Tax=Caenorhabditis auriculariae TaxID=2777116 RepID=A0A8S1HCP8_9PELO|nr:unnamed protein product [Caenorhabditis auriculariae]